LTRREAEVLGLLAQGLSNKEIAAILCLSDRTIERHVTGLYRKIGVGRRTEATAYALRYGLVDATDLES
jgi:DNA-binding NarL/FixJ family response regulator